VLLEPRPQIANRKSQIVRRGRDGALFAIRNSQFAALRHSPFARRRGRRLMTTHRIALKSIAWAIALTLVTLPVIGVLNGWFAGDRWPVRYLRVDAEFNHVSAEQIRAATAMHLGTGFFAIDLDRVRASVAALPWVERVEVRKRWPDTLQLRVVEREPFARWGSDRLIGRDGALFSAPGAESIQGLPQLNGPDDALADVIAFYNAGARLFSGTGLALSGVTLSARGSWKLVLAGGAEIEVGRERTSERLQRFVDVLPRLVSAHGGFERADLRYANGFAIRWTAVEVPAPVKGKES
jgi:cell division protein FtsQ